MIYAIYSTASLILACILASFFTKQKPNYLVIGLVAIVYFLSYSMIAHSDEIIPRYSCKVLEYTYENTSENYEWFENTVWGHCRRMHIRPSWFHALMIKKEQVIVLMFRAGSRA